MRPRLMMSLAAIAAALIAAPTTSIALSAKDEVRLAYVIDENGELSYIPEGSYTARIECRSTWAVSTSGALPADPARHEYVVRIDYDGGRLLFEETRDGFTTITSLICSAFDLVPIDTQPQATMSAVGDCPDWIYGENKWANSRIAPGYSQTSIGSVRCIAVWGATGGESNNVTYYVLVPAPFTGAVVAQSANGLKVATCVMIASVCWSSLSVTNDAYPGAVWTKGINDMRGSAVGGWGVRGAT